MNGRPLPTPYPRCMGSAVPISRLLPTAGREEHTAVAANPFPVAMTEPSLKVTIALTPRSALPIAWFLPTDGARFSRVSALVRLFGFLQVPKEFENASFALLTRVHVCVY